jgi:hypothetical protein
MLPIPQCSWLLTELGRDDIASSPSASAIFEADKPISAYVDVAQEHGRIVA